jgi:hypothetical protein
LKKYEIGGRELAVLPPASLSQFRIWLNMALWTVEEIFSVTLSSSHTVAGQGLGCGLDSAHYSQSRLGSVAGSGC